MNNTYILISIAIMAIVTIVLRAIPFIFLSNKKEYKTLNYLSNVLPCAIMGMLVVYCLKDIKQNGTLLISSNNRGDYSYKSTIKINQEISSPNKS